MKKSHKVLFLIFSSLLFLAAAILFCIAVFHDERQPMSSNSQIHVFINQNDSIVTKLQEDVEHLSSLIEKMSADTVIIEMRKPKPTE